MSANPYHHRKLPSLALLLLFLPVSCLRAGYEVEPLIVAGSNEGLANAPTADEQALLVSQQFDMSPNITMFDAATGAGLTGSESGELNNETLNEPELDAKRVPAAWWDTSFAFRRRLRVDNRAQSEDLTDFPVAVRLNCGLGNCVGTQSTGEDLRFVSANGSSVLAHEIESWDTAG